jgi:hypothetical protein
MTRLVQPDWNVLLAVNLNASIRKRDDGLITYLRKNNDQAAEAIRPQ